MKPLKVKLDPGAICPKRAHQTDAGLDLFMPLDTNVIVPAHGRAFVDTGVHIEIPYGFFGLLTSKSGLMRDRGIKCTGTIDAGYTGSIGAVLFNNSDEDVEFRAGDKLTQLLILPCFAPSLNVVEELKETERGSGGFGSTGR